MHKQIFYLHFPCPMCNPNVRNVPSAHLSIWIFIRCPPGALICVYIFRCSSYVFHTFFLRSFLHFHTIPTISVSRKSNQNHQFPYFPTVIPIRLPTVILHTFPTVLLICFLWSFHTFLPTSFQAHATAQGSFPKFSYYLRSAYVFIWFHKFFVMPVRPLFPIVFLRSSYVSYGFRVGIPRSRHQQYFHTFPFVFHTIAFSSVGIQFPLP